MPTKITLEVELVTCACELIAFPGEKLMLLNGSVIGHAPKDEAKGNAKSDVIAVKPQMPIDNKQRTRRRDYSQLTTDKIRDTLVGHDGLTTAEIADLWGIPDYDQMARHTVGRRLQRLRTLKLVDIKPGDVRSRRPAYVWIGQTTVPLSAQSYTNSVNHEAVN